jgi:hypothetical protein
VKSQVIIIPLIYKIIVLIKINLSFSNRIDDSSEVKHSALSIVACCRHYSELRHLNDVIDSSCISSKGFHDTALSNINELQISQSRCGHKDVGLSLTEHQFAVATVF